MFLSISVQYHVIISFFQPNVENSNNWKEELQKYISPDQLPQAYGGTRCEPDPYCTDYVSSLNQPLSQLFQHITGMYSTLCIKFRPSVMIIRLG